MKGCCEAKVTHKEEGRVGGEAAAKLACVSADNRVFRMDSTFHIRQYLLHQQSILKLTSFILSINTLSPTTSASDISISDMSDRRWDKEAIAAEDDDDDNEWMDEEDAGTIN